MANKLPLVGVEVVALGSDKFFSTLSSVEKATQSTTRALEQSASKTQLFAKSADGATKSMSPFLKAFDSASSKLGGFGQQMNGVVQSLAGAQSGVSSFFAELPAGAAGLTLAAAGAAAFATAFVALGQRGAGLIGISESFDRLAQSAGIDAVAALTNLRIASGGTVADFELLRLTNLALAGATGEFGKQFGENLPRILEIARVQARATGQSVDFLFQSLITGIKRGSPLLIDNTGLVLKISAANEAMAQSLGKSVEQLTAEEKQLAVLNATLAAGQTAIDAFSGMQETSADKMARMNSTITNMLDTLAVGVQPAFGMVLDVVNRILSVFSGLVTAMNPLISAFLEAGTALFTGPLNAILAIIEPLSKLVNWFWTLVTVLVQPVLKAFTTVFNAIGTGVQRVVDFIGGAFAAVGLTFDTLALSVGVSAGALVAAMGNGMLQAYNAVVAPVVLFIATAIADFLIGQSPPPKGPLSQIDKGGAATMTAWMEGFAGVSLQPVSEVAAAVEATLGNVGRMSLPQVEARLGTLDQALAPFNNQLEIIKANFEAIATPAQAALDAIERQTAKAQEALAAGDIGAAERIRALDEQRAMIEKAVDAQQTLVDQAQVQQALAKAQQAPERALLAIQQARLKALETKKTPEAKAAAEAAGKGGAVGTPDMAAVAGGGGAGFDMSLPSVSDLISGQGAVDQMGADLGTGFTAGFAGSINQGTLAAFQENQRLIGAQTDRIGQANIGQRVADAFSGISTSIQTKLNEASVVISDWIGGITDPAREGSIPFGFNALINGDWSLLTTSLTAPFTNAGLDITAFLDEMFNPENVNSIPGTLALLPTRITNALREVETAFSDSVLVPIQNTITDIGLAVARFFVETGEGTLSGYIDAGVAWFVALPQRIFDAMSSIGQIFFAVFATPMVGALNLVIEALEGFINSALSGLGTLVGSLQGVADAVGLGAQLAEMSASLVTGINLPRLAMPVAPAASMPGAARGGIFSSGLMRVGERGAEVMANAASKTAVFPANVTRDLDIIARILGGGGSMPLPLLAGNGGNTNNSNVYNQTFNQPAPASSGNAVQQIATMMAMKRR